MSAKGSLAGAWDYGKFSIIFIANGNDGVWTFLVSMLPRGPCLRPGYGARLYVVWFHCFLSMATRRSLVQRSAPRESMRWFQASEKSAGMLGEFMAFGGTRGGFFS